MVFFRFLLRKSESRKFGRQKSKRTNKASRSSKSEEGAVVSSRSVAENFGKKHFHVLKSIENIIIENSILTSMFHESSYTAGTGKAYKEYFMNRDGFSLLVMGFTGKKALEWKIKYIDAFNQMEEQLCRRENIIIENSILTSMSQPKSRLSGKIRRPLEADTAYVHPSVFSSGKIRRQIFIYEYRCFEGVYYSGDTALRPFKPFEGV